MEALLHTIGNGLEQAANTQGETITEIRELLEQLVSINESTIAICMKCSERLELVDGVVDYYDPSSRTGHGQYNVHYLECPVCRLRIDLKN